MAVIRKPRSNRLAAADRRAGNSPAALADEMTLSVVCATAGVSVRSGLLWPCLARTTPRDQNVYCRGRNPLSLQASLRLANAQGALRVVGLCNKLASGATRGERGAWKRRTKAAQGKGFVPAVFGSRLTLRRCRHEYSRAHRLITVKAQHQVVRLLV